MRVGKVATSAVVDFVLDRRSRIRALGEDPETSLLVLPQTAPVLDPWLPRGVAGEGAVWCGLQRGKPRQAMLYSPPEQAP